MAEYIYRALDASGKFIQGTVIAEDVNSALENLRARNIYIVEIKEKSALHKEIKLPFGQKATIKDLSVFCRQFATMLAAGISILSCLDVLRNQYRGRPFGKVIDDLYEKVERGTLLSTAMREHPRFFPPILINMVEAGEVAGSIDKSMDKMATHFEKELKLRQKIVNALIYPAIVIGVAVIVLIILLTFVIPTFVGLFDELNVELPATTKFVINSSKFMQKNGLYLLFFIIALILGYKIFKGTKSGGILIGKIKIKIPVIGRVVLGQVTSRFTRTLATLLNAGVPLITALDTTKNVMANTYIEQEFEKVIERVKGGEGLSYPIEDIGIFPQLVNIMLKTGEETGRLEYMLEKAADYYENEVENQITRLTALFEPVMIVCLAVMVGFLLASIIMPMFKLYGSIGS
ncbi:type II secretion system F family protein [Caldicellulosiruptor changbaiensis]|uniref:Type II secretion system F family protein n=1 Tax=Caldicellulosiruptor changbaiensis TaxID=1222016 RepID=A0A3T0D730_9FIRM|nr:type II secretion system F family protein [Caldicellulosiruptor changbaiensis]AZT90863.1 type II secretion system F family protein [Caldicellulosiruptor changbaiensis]